MAVGASNRLTRRFTSPRASRSFETTSRDHLTTVMENDAVEEDVAIVVPRQSLIDRFLEVRGIEGKKVTPPTLTTKPSGSTRTIVASATLARLPPRTMWQGYAKRTHGKRIAFARRAMRLPDDTYSDSIDVYNPKKPPLTFVNVHEDADEISRQFLYRARCLIFEREVVGVPVCDLIENQIWYDQALDHVYATRDSEESANPVDQDDSESRLMNLDTSQDPTASYNM